MITTMLSSKGQIVIPKEVRRNRGWPPGMKFILEELPAGILLRPSTSFSPTDPREGLGCAGYSGRRQSVSRMKQGIDSMMRQRWRRKSTP